MNREIGNDPRQVLAILNSLGIVGVTAVELKAFMKELKLYRKVKELECQQWKEEVRQKISRQGLLKKQHTHLSKLNSVVDSREAPRIDKRKIVLEPQTALILNTDTRYGSVNSNKENNSHQNHSNMPLPERNKKSDRIAKNVERIHVEDSAKKMQPDSLPNRPAMEQPQSIQKTKSATSSHSRKSLTPCSRSKSFIRSQSQSCLDSRMQSSKKSNNDPVALYNKYKSIWERLSLPGEETHAKLRWAVREKMLGSEPFPKPVLQTRIVSKHPITRRMKQ